MTELPIATEVEGPTTTAATAVLADGEDIEAIYNTTKPPTPLAWHQINPNLISMKPYNQPHRDGSGHHFVYGGTNLTFQGPPMIYSSTTVVGRPAITRVTLTFPGVEGESPTDLSGPIGSALAFARLVSAVDSLGESSVKSASFTPALKRSTTGSWFITRDCDSSLRTFTRDGERTDSIPRGSVVVPLFNGWIGFEWGGGPRRGECAIYLNPTELVVLREHTRNGMRINMDEYK